MYDIAEHVQNWLADGREVRVAQVIATRGFSSRHPAASCAWTRTDSGTSVVGDLGNGIDVTTLDGGLVDVTISEDDALAAGLACGGVASVLVQPASAYPAALWSRLLDREPLCLVTPIGADGVAGITELYTPRTVREAAKPGAYGDPVPRLMGRGTTGAALIEDEGRRVAAVALWPVPALVVVGDGLIADALAGAAQLLGWTCHVTPQLEPALAAIAGLQRSDALVVLSHDRAVDGPVLAAALAGGAGYLGALGSRHTQAARREWLTGHGVDPAHLDRIHGPAGLDIDAHTPGEIAVSIVGEILANRAGSSGGSLRQRPGPVHTAGVPAPPPRY